MTTIKKDAKKTKLLNLRVYEDFINKLRKQALKENRTVSNLIETVLGNYLKKHS